MPRYKDHTFKKILIHCIVQNCPYFHDCHRFSRSKLNERVHQNIVKYYYKYFQHVMSLLYNHQIIVMRNISIKDIQKFFFVQKYYRVFNEMLSNLRVSKTNFIKNTQ